MYGKEKKLTNLWEETVQALADAHKCWDDIKFVSIDSGEIFKPVFENLAKEINYDAGYGTEKIREDIKLVGDGWWLERYTYDGSEWWVFKRCPARPTEVAERAILTSDYRWRRD